jgi:protein gp37
MGVATSIAWTSATWNPWRGCTKVSPGCAHCYMFREQRRYGRDPATVVRAADATFYAPLRGRRWRRLALGSHVFTCSWSDWFHEHADPWRNEAWDVIRQRPDLIWQILTKRPERIADCLPADWGEGWPHVWLGVSIENRRYVHRAELLRQAPAAVRFISAEPLLGPLVSYDAALNNGSSPEARFDGYIGAALELTGIDWLIIGGESGPRARRFDIAWARALISAARRHGTAVHIKQPGTRWARAHGGRSNDPSGWPPDLRLRELPDTRSSETHAYTSRPTPLHRRRSA